MKQLVLDASVALAWFIDSPVPSYAVGVREAILRGARGHVPALWHLEMANGIIVAERRRILTADDAVRALKNLEQFVLQTVETHGDIFPLRQAFNTARLFHLSAYDSVYLDLARHEGLPLATLDRSLLAAAKQAGVNVFN